MSNEERMKANRLALEVAIGYEAIDISLDRAQFPEGLRLPNKTWRTITDRDGLVDRIVPLLEERDAKIAELEERIRRAIEDADDLLATQDVNHEEDNYAAGQVHAADSIRNILVSLEVEK